MNCINKPLVKIFVFFSTLITSSLANANVEIPEKDDIFENFGDGDIITQGVTLAVFLAYLAIGYYLVTIIFSMASSARIALARLQDRDGDVKDVVVPVVAAIGLIGIIVLMSYFILGMFDSYRT